MTNCTTQLPTPDCPTGDNNSFYMKYWTDKYIFALAPPTLTIALHLSRSQLYSGCEMMEGSLCYFDGSLLDGLMVLISAQVADVRVTPSLACNYVDDL